MMKTQFYTLDVKSFLPREHLPFLEKGMLATDFAHAFGVSLDEFLKECHEDFPVHVAIIGVRSDLLPKGTDMFVLAMRVLKSDENGQVRYLFSRSHVELTDLCPSSKTMTPMRDDPDLKGQTVVDIRGSGVISPDELRTELDLEPIHRLEKIFHTQLLQAVKNTQSLVVFDL